MPQRRSPDPRFRRWQGRVFVIAWLSYGSFYLCRVNLAVALPAIRADLGWSKSTAGLIGSLFLWVYAVGQLINGTLGQKADARWFVGLGMLASAACGVAFGSSSWLWLMAVLWALNGWVQSMGWGPIMKTIAAWFDPRRRGRITAFFSPCFVLGHLLAWTAGGWLASRWGWRYAFWLPATALAAMGLVWLLGIRSTPDQAGFRGLVGSNGRAGSGLRDILGSVLAQPRVRWAALVCVFSSMIKDGLNLWAPTFLVEAMGMRVDRAAWAASVLPLFGLCGSLLAGYLSDRLFRSREAPGLIGLLSVIALAMVGFRLLSGVGALWAAVALLAGCGAAVYGINALLTTSMPLSFSAEGNVGAVAGFLDFASYVGGGLSALIVGQLLDWRGWSAVFTYWLIAALLGLAVAVILLRQIDHRQEDSGWLKPL